MNILKKTIIPAVMVLGLGLSGCADFLDVTPHDSQDSENALVTLTDFDNATNAVYETMRSSSYESVFLPQVGDIMSDNLVMNPGGRQTYNEFHSFRFSATTYGTAGFWSAAYNAILSTNEVITRLENREFSADEEAYGKNLLAEAKALRGLIHFDLVRVYGKDYKSASETDLGVTYKKDCETTLPPRNTVREVYGWLVEDLEDAFSTMTDDYNADINYRLNKKSIAAELARVYLTMGEDLLAVQRATAAIAGDGSDLANVSAYSAIYSGSMEGNAEVLFRIALLASDGILPGNEWGQGTSSSYTANYTVPLSLYEMYADNDCRRQMIRTMPNIDGVDCNVVWKWNGAGQTTGLVDIPVIRTTEIYLTRAEANYNLGNYPDALDDLNYVRRNRYANYTDGTETGSNLEAAILLERRLDLAFEGHRFFDLKRRGEDLVRSGDGHLADGTGTPSSVQNVPASSPYWLLAIPQEEIDANDNMEQNNY